MTKRQSELFPELPSDKKYVSDYPELVAEWHPTKNGSLSPDDYLHGSNKKVWWQCKHDHEWNASIVNRVRDRGCPYCSNNKIMKICVMYNIKSIFYICCHYQIDYKRLA